MNNSRQTGTSRAQDGMSREKGKKWPLRFDRFVPIGRFLDRLEASLHGRVLVIVLIGIMLISLIPVLGVRYVPLQDYATHLAGIHILKHINDADAGYSSVFVSNVSPRPNVLSDLMILWLSSFMQIRIAGKVILVLYLLLVPIAWLMLARAWQAPAWLFLGAPLIIYNWLFDFGFLNFSLSVPLCLITYSCWRRPWSPRWIWVITVIAMSLTVFFAHIVGFAVLIWCVMLSLWLGQIRPSWHVSLMIFSPSLALAAGFMGLFPLGTLQTAPMMDKNVLISKSISTLETLWSPIFTNPPLSQTFLCAVFVFGSLYLTIYAGKRCGEHLSIILSLFILFLVIPDYLGLDFVAANTRLLYFMIPFALTGMAGHWLTRRSGFLLTLAAMITGLISIRIHARDFRELQPHFETLLSGLDEFEPGSSLLPVMLEKDESRWQSPLTGAWSYYHLERGGWNPYVFANHPYDLIRWRHERPAAPWIWSDELSPQEYFSAYQYCLVWGPLQKEKESKLNDWFELVVADERLRLYRNISYKKDR